MMTAGNMTIDGDSRSNNDRIRVAVRIRPPLPKEYGKETCVEKNEYDETSIRVTDPGRIIESKYDRVFYDE